MYAMRRSAVWRWLTTRVAAYWRFRPVTAVRFITLIILTLFGGLHVFLLLHHSADTRHIDDQQVPAAHSFLSSSPSSPPSVTQPPLHTEESTQSGATGRAFSGARTRAYSKPLLYQGSATSLAETHTPTHTKPHARAYQRWAVCTTVHDAGEAILQFVDAVKWERVGGGVWGVVVVGDKATPESLRGLAARGQGHVVVLDVERQREWMEAEGLAKLLQLQPWNHLARKNLGYLYAIAHGAEEVWDFDDDNVLKDVTLLSALSARVHPGRTLQQQNQHQQEQQQHRQQEQSQQQRAHLFHQQQTPEGAPSAQPSPYAHLEEEEGHHNWIVQEVSLHPPTHTHTHTHTRTHPTTKNKTTPSSAGHTSDYDDCRTVFNPLPLMGGEGGDHPIWPRGLPLRYIRGHQTCGYRLMEAGAIQDVVVFQSLADGEPDVDAVYRLTHRMSVSFREEGLQHPCILLPPLGTLTPYNAQATLHTHPSLWALFLPTTVTGRVSDIWRSYITQRLLQDLQLRVAYTSPMVDHNRNSHDLTADLAAECDLYFKGERLVQFLQHTWRGNATTVEGRYEELMVALYEREYVQETDVEIVQEWIAALRHVGYRFPLLNADHSSRGGAARAGEHDDLSVGGGARNGPRSMRSGLVVPGGGVNSGGTDVAAAATGSEDSSSINGVKKEAGVTRTRTTTADTTTRHPPLPPSNPCTHTSNSHNHTTPARVVLITGITGMIGSHVARALVATRPCYVVYGLVRPRSNLDTLAGVLHRVRLVTGDITDGSRMASVLSELRPDYIYHFAAQGINGISYDIPHTTLDVNIAGTANLLESVHRLNLTTTRILLAGSSTVYGKTAGDNRDAPIPESAPTEPVSPYGVSKLAMEKLGNQYATAFGMKIVTARFFIQVGVGGTDSLAIHQFCKQIAMAELGVGEAVVAHGNLDTARDMTDARDSAGVIVQLAEKGVVGEAYNVGTGHAMTMRDLLHIALSLAKVPINTVLEPAKLRVYDEKVLLADNRKVRELTGWIPATDMRDTVRTILGYWRRKVRALYVVDEGEEGGGGSEGERGGGEGRGVGERAPGSGEGALVLPPPSKQQQRRQQQQHADGLVVPDGKGADAEAQPPHVLPRLTSALGAHGSPPQPDSPSDPTDTNLAPHTDTHAHITTDIAADVHHDPHHQHHHHQQRQRQQQQVDDKRPCPTSNIDVLFVTCRRDFPLTSFLMRSIDTFMPCHGHVHVIIDRDDVQALRAWMNVDDPRVRVHALDVPVPLEHLSGYIRQAWVMMWADRFVELTGSSADFIMFMDTDSALGLPVTCNSLFDADGRVYIAGWHLPTRQAMFVRCVHDMVGPSTTSYMSYFPFTMPVSSFSRMRAHIAQRLSIGGGARHEKRSSGDTNGDKMIGGNARNATTDFDAAFVAWTHRANPNTFSQFAVMGAYLELYEPDRVHAMYCPVYGQHTQSECAQWVPPGTHFGWRPCAYVDGCAEGGYMNQYRRREKEKTTTGGKGGEKDKGEFDRYTNKFAASTIDVLEKMFADGVCFRHNVDHNGTSARPGCTHEQSVRVNEELLPYPLDPPSLESLQRRFRADRDGQGLCRSVEALSRRVNVM